jgi:hypothetical protein
MIAMIYISALSVTMPELFGGTPLVLPTSQTSSLTPKTATYQNYAQCLVNNGGAW